MSVDAAPVATLASVSRTYGSGATAVEALADVSLVVWPGELVVILGPSGSGKTTLLNLLGAIERPTSGQVVVGGHDLGTLDARALADVRRDTLGFVFQFFNLVSTLTAAENVSLVAELTGRGDQHEAVDRVLAELGLATREDHFPGQLSGGEQQRVAIARALVKQPRLLLCDEPTGALDVETGRRILALLERQAHVHDRAVVIVTHNAAIAGMADRVIRLRSGEVAADDRNDQPIAVDQVDW